jgi:hypothetical protein
MQKRQANVVKNLSPSTSYGVDRFELAIAVDMKSTVFWNVTPWSLVEVYVRFAGPHCLLLQD